MEEDECSNMLDHLQQYVPHLEKLIAQLKDPKRKNRELQLNKLEGLHSMITDRKKKLKLDTLKKCEDVILKILQKVHPSAYQQIEQQSYYGNVSYNMKLVCKDPPENTNSATVSANVLNSIRFNAARARLNEVSATPASPSPPRDVIITHAPIVIPTEKVNKTKITFQDDFYKNTWDNRSSFDKPYTDVYKTEKPDVYRKAAESLNSYNDKKFGFDRLGAKLDMSKPPLSSEDLEQLTITDLPLEDTHDLEQLEDLREKIQRKLQYTEEHKVEYTDLRDKLMKNKASKEKFFNSIKDDSSNKSKNSRVELIFKDPDSKFGTLLSSIDQKILGEGGVKKKDKHKEIKSEKDKSSEKRDGHKEKKSHRDDKKEPKSHHVKKEKDEKQILKDNTTPKIHNNDANNTNKEHKHKKDGEKILKSQEETKDKTEKSSKSQKDSKHKIEKSTKPQEDHKVKIEKFSKSQVEPKDKTEKFSKPQTESKNTIKKSSSPQLEFKEKIKITLKCQEPVQNSNGKSTNLEESGNKQDVTVYKRLADKYNPRPRKSSNDTQIVENVYNKPIATSDRTGLPIPTIDNSMNFGLLREIINKVNNSKPSFNSPTASLPPSIPPKIPQMVPSPSGLTNFTTNKVCPTEQPMNVPNNNYNCPQQNLPNAQCGNTIVNAYILQNNIGNNGQFQSSVNNVQNIYHNQMPHSNMFHPFEPIKNNEYDLSAMQPIDYYPPQYQSQNNSKPLPPPLLSPHSQYNNTNQIVGPSNYQKQPIHQNSPYPNSQQYNLYAQKERSPCIGRPKPDTWPSDPRINSQSKEESYRGISNRDPRIRNREMKDKYHVNNIRDNCRPQTPVRRPSFNEPITKYDSFYSDYAKTTKDFVSPLDSLYSTGDASQITGKGYGVQKFKIPRKKNNESHFKQHLDKKDKKLEETVVKEKADDVSNTIYDDSMCLVDSDDDTSIESFDECVKKKDDDNKKVDIKKKADVDKEVDTNKNAAVDKEIDVKKEADVDEKVKIENKDSGEDIHVDKTVNVDEEIDTNKKVIIKLLKIEDDKNVDCSKETVVEKKDNIEVDKKVDIEIDKKIDFKVDKNVEEVPKEESKEKKVEEVPSLNNESVFVGLISNLIQTSKNTELLNALLNTLTATASDEQKQKWLEKLINSSGNETPATTENEVKVIKDTQDNDEDGKESETDVSQPKTKKQLKNAKLIKKGKFKKGVKKNKILRRQLKTKFKPSSDESDEEEEENVIETVGERIKSRRRNVKSPTAPKSVRKTELTRRSELDKLHEDIKEMFIRDGVITATGKRLCRTVKNNPQTSVEPNLNSLKTRTRSSSALESNKSILDPPKIHANCRSPKVIIERTDISKHLPVKTVNKVESENKGKKTVSQKRGHSEKRSLSPDTDSPKSKKTYVEDSSDDESPSKKPKIELESNKSNKNEEESDDHVTSEKDSSSKKANKKRKRGHSWAIGVINKKVRKKLDVNDSTPLLDNTKEILDNDDSKTKSPSPNTTTESVKKDIKEHDVNYYFDPHDKISCKLCQFKGKYIVQHYRSNHPKNEMLISRISPDASKDAIDQSIENNYESVNAETIKVGRMLKKFTYKCRFCQILFRDVSSEVFYDHLTSHTGEFRFICNYCSYKTNGVKTLRTHLHYTHNKRCENSGPLSASRPACPNFDIVFGYICSECNFIQLIKSCMENHMEKYHTKDDKIHKINMSSYISETTENNVEQEKEVEKEVENENDNEKTVENEVPPEEPETQKKDPTVFKCDTVYTQESVKLDEQKHKKMMEISETVISKKKCGLDLLDKIKNRLNDKSVENYDDVPENENLLVKDCEKINKNDSVNSEKKNEQENGIQKVIHRCIEELLPPIAPEVENMIITGDGFRNLLNNKNCEPVLNTIERLQDMLNVPPDPPPLIPINKLRFENEIKTEDTVIQVGPVTARKKNNYVLYMCYMESCLYSSVNENEFDSHCKLFHNNQHWDGICNICNENTNALSIDGAFDHLLKIHKKELIDGFDRQKSLHSSSKSSNSQDDNLIKPTEESTVRIVNIQSIIDDKQEEKDEQTHDFPFMISNVTTLTPEEDEALTAFQVSKTQPSKSSPVTTPPFNVMFPIPTLLPLSNSPKNNANTNSNINTNSKPTNPKSTQKIWLKSLPLATPEKSVPYKTELAEKCLLGEKKLAQLYKCPHSNCIFSSDMKKEFNTHLKHHIDSNTTLEVPCVYCKIEIDFHTIGVHYEIKHGQSQYCCKYCFYRAMTQSYVEMHQEKQHPEEDRHIIKISANPESLLDYNQPYIPLFTKFLSKYICGQSGCEKKFTFGTDYLEHLTNDHKGVPLICYFCKTSINSSRKTITHMESHNIFHYHCGFCSFGGVSLDVVYKHLAELHYWLNPKIITRQLIRDEKGHALNQKNIYESSHTELSKCINVITSEYLKYITTNALHEYVPQSTSVVCNLPGNPSNIITLYKAPLSKKKSSAKLRNTETVDASNNKNNPTEIIKCNVTLSIGRVFENAFSPVDVTNKVTTSVIDGEEPMVDFNQSADKLVVDIQDPLYLGQDNLETNNKTINEQTKVEFTDLTPEEVSFSVDNTTKQQNLVGLDLFQCNLCLAGFLTAQNFKNHIVKCVDLYKIDTARPFKCNHCVKAFKTSNGLLDHIRLHGIQRFACSICDFKHQHQLNVRSHIKTKHNITNVTITPVNPNKNNFDEDEFIVRPKVNRRKSKDGFGVNKDITAGGGINGNIKTEYGPKEINSLPIRPIFTQEIKCSECGYGTKVRLNLVRHLEFHKTGKELPVPSMAPVNLVPCLQKTEKMFDKMTNLALSSFNDIARMASKFEKRIQNSQLSPEEEAGLPLFVTSTRRYVCGVSDCDYLCLEESMLRCHLTTLHGGQECSYKCTHCQEKLSTEKGIINIEQIIKHLRLHDLHLYKCKYCKFIHNLKHKVDRHVVDKHTDQPPIVIIIREMEHEPVLNTYHYQEEIKENKVWYCGMCKYRCGTKIEISTHVFNKHNLDTQYKCALCQFKNSLKSSFTEHFEITHPKQNVDVIDAYYHADEIIQKPTSETKMYDTTPLWLQDKILIRHIRGIPLDDNKKVVKKSPVKSMSASINLDRAIEAVASGTQTTKSDEMPPRKPKTLKEKMSIIQNDDNNELIQIEDEIYTSSSKRSENKISTLDLVVSSVTQGVGSDLETLFMPLNTQENELHSLDIETLKTKELSGEFGPYGKPFNEYFLCPLCSTFKSKKGEQLINHLYRELDYPRFVCTTCGSTGVSHDYLKRHSLKTHVNLPVVIQPLSPDSSIETWVSTVLYVQTRIIESIKNKRHEIPNILPVAPTIKLESLETLNDSPQLISSELDIKTNVIKYQCQYCNYCSKSQSDLRKHEKRHWAQKPLKCGYCNTEGVTAYEITQHSKRAHPNDAVLVVAVPTPITPVIKPLLKKGKYKRKKDSTNNSNDTPESEESESEPLNKDETLYVCNYCPKRSNTIDVMKKHWEQIHKSKQLTFKFHRILSSVNKDGVVHYKCAYCDYMGVMCEVKKHCGLNHPDHSLMFRHKCQCCTVYFKDEDELHLHYSEAHGDMEVNDVDDKDNRLALVSCNICDLEFNSFDKLLDHRKFAHPNIEASGQRKYKCPQCGHTTPNYTAMRDHVRGHAKPYKCFYCPLRATYPSVIKSHHIREHPDEEFKSQLVPEGKKMNELLRQKIMVLDERGIYNSISIHKNNQKSKSTVSNHTNIKFQIEEVKSEPIEEIKSERPVKMTARKSTSITPPSHFPIKMKETARKSTTVSFTKPTLNIVEDGISHYGNKPDLENVENVKTELSFQDSSVPVSVSKLYDIVNMFPLVSVVDYKKNEMNDV